MNDNCKLNTAMWNTYEIHICPAVVDESQEWSSQQIFQFKQLEGRSLKISGLQRVSNPRPLRHRCDARPTELWSRTLGARSICWVHILPCSEMMWNIYVIHICTAVIESRSSAWYFQTSSFQLLRLENLLRWSHFTFIYNCSTNMNFIYISHHFTPRVDMNSQLSWSSIAPVSRRSRVRIPLKPWYFQASSFQLLKFENLLQWSLFPFFLILPVGEMIVTSLQMWSKVLWVIHYKQAFHSATFCNILPFFSLHSLSLVIITRLPAFKNTFYVNVSHGAMSSFISSTC